MGARRRDGSAGVTLLELVIAVAVMGAVFIALFNVLARAQDLETHAIVMADLRAKARVAVERIARELRDSGPSTFSPPPIAPLGGSSLVYRRADGRTASTPTFGGQRRIEWRASAGEAMDGIDNDRDGLVDEGAVVWTEDPFGSPPGREVIFVDGVGLLGAGEAADVVDNNANGLVDEAGLSFDLSGEILTIRLTLERRGPKGGVLRASAEAAVRVQNP